METIQYKTYSRSSKTPCPYGMMGTCEACKITKPVLVHVGSWMENDCPYYGGHAEKKKQIVCNFAPGDQATVYNSR